MEATAEDSVGRRGPAEEVDAVSAVSELEVREWLEEQGAGAEEPGGGELPLFLPRRLHGICRNGVGGGTARLPLSIPFVLYACSRFLCYFLGAHHTFAG